MYADTYVNSVTLNMRLPMERNYGSLIVATEYHENMIRKYLRNGNHIGVGCDWKIKEMRKNHVL